MPQKANLLKALRLLRQVYDEVLSGNTMSLDVGDEYLLAHCALYLLSPIDADEHLCTAGEKPKIDTMCKSLSGAKHCISCLSSGKAVANLTNLNSSVQELQKCMTPITDKICWVNLSFWDIHGGRQPLLAHVANDAGKESFNRFWKAYSDFTNQAIGKDLYTINELIAWSSYKQNYILTLNQTSAANRPNTSPLEFIIDEQSYKAITGDVARKEPQELLRALLNNDKATSESESLTTLAATLLNIRQPGNVAKTIEPLQKEPPAIAQLRQARTIAACYKYWKDSVPQGADLEHIYFFQVGSAYIFQSMSLATSQRQPEPVSILAIGTKDPLEDFEQDFLDAFSHSILTRVLMLNLFANERRRALNAATAAIISRNMSHNLGSHVLARHSGGWENPPDVGSLASSKCALPSPKFDRLRGAIDGVLKKQWTAIKDDQQLDRWLQARMDFVAQVATEWPRWVESAQLVGEIIWGMLRQRVLLREIVASEGIGSHEWAAGKTALDGCSGTDEDSKQPSGKAIRLDCCKVSLDSWPKKDEGRTKACALRNGHCILCIPPDGEPTINLGNDIAVAIPGGLTGWHAFYVIVENIIRNAAKHQRSDKRGADGANPLNIYIEILDDSKGNIHIKNRPEEAGWPAWLVRVYDNSSVLEEEKGLANEINGKFNEPIIDASGELNREHWGLAEMKIAAAYLQRRDLERLGEGGQSVTGNESPLHEGTQGSAIIRAVASPMNTLGYEFFLLKPTRLAIACQMSPADNGGERK